MDIYLQLEKIQKTLNAPKNKRNTFGKYNYRDCEGILNALKPHLDGFYIHLTDSIELVGDRVYVKAVATMSDGKQSISSTGFAREPESKKGMDESQITGAASSYARKYALNALFMIDDSKDADHDSGGAGGNEKRASSAAIEGSFVVDDLAKQWIAACMADPSAIQQIADPKYKLFITQQMKAIP